MTYKKAQKLKNNDIVTIKKTNYKVSIITTRDFTEEKQVIVYCDDGNLYIHTDIL